MPRRSAKRADIEQRQHAQHRDIRRGDAVHQRYRQALAMRSPSNTAGTLASIMPSVVPVTRSVRVGAQDAAASRL